MGTATAAWQIEGSVATRGRCIWDDFAERPGAIVDGTVGEPACDHLNRIDEDLDLLTWLGVDAYRFSFSWPRIQPGGTGPASPAGVAVYDRIIDGLLERGISPVATLYHWDLPSDLPGWTSRETAERFADYTALVADRFADRVDMWATLNEPWVSAYLGYAIGIHAPGVVDPGGSLAAAYHLMLAHGLGMQRLRAAGARRPGIVLNLIPAVAEDPGAEAARRHVDGLHNRFFLDLLAGRGIPADVRQTCASLTDWSFVRDDDLPIISAPIDWIGENYYTINRISSTPTGASGAGQDLAAYPACPPAFMAPREPRTAMGWEVIESGLIDVLHMAAQALPGVPIHVTENGAAFEDAVSTDGRVHDPQRVDYYRRHIDAALEARAQGVPVEGYFAWSLLDNIEWAEGMTKRFGIVRVEPGTMQRIPKDSALWLRERLAARRSAAG